MDFKNRITENIVKSIKSHIREVFDRKLVKSDQFFDAISTMKGDVRMCVGYITAEPLDLLPKIKKRNPETNRMKGYPDFESFGKEYDIAGTIAGIVKLTKYSGFNYVRPDDLSKRYAAARDTWNQIDSNYGLKPVDKDSKNGKYTTTQQFGNNNLKVYGGENDSIKNHSYFPQNTFGARISSTYFVINDEGNIIANLTREQLAKYIKKKNPYKVDALIKLDRSAEEIEQYIKEMDAVKMRYQQFENSKILYMAAKSTDLGKFAFINDRLADVIGDVKINTRQFMQIAASQYSIDIQKLDESINNNNNNNNMRITENTLRKLVKESILKVLKEEYDMPNNKWQASNKETIYELGKLSYDFWTKSFDKICELNLENINIPLRTFDKYIGNVVKIKRGIIVLDNGEEIPFNDLEWKESMVLIDALEELF